MRGLLMHKDVSRQITTPGIYHDVINGLISFSSDGTNRTTISDKNLGATTVWDGIKAEGYGYSYMGVYYAVGGGTTDAGFHKPTKSEREFVISTLSSLGISTVSNFKQYLKMPGYGYKKNNGSLQSYTNMRYWTDTKYNLTNYNCLIGSNRIQFSNIHSSYLMFRRLFADTPVQPDNTRTVLYQQ